MHKMEPISQSDMMQCKDSAAYKGYPAMQRAGIFPHPTLKCPSHESHDDDCLMMHVDTAGDGSMKSVRWCQSDLWQNWLSSCVDDTYMYRWTHNATINKKQQTLMPARKPVRHLSAVAIHQPRQCSYTYYHRVQKIPAQPDQPLETLNLMS